MAARQSTTAPVDVGRLNRAPKHPPASSSTSPTTSSMPIGSARVREHGDRLRMGVVVDDEAVATPHVDSRRAIAIASAAAVASSSSEALATGEAGQLG